jgi:aminopeptidase N
VAYQAVKNATNMTDRFAALVALERCNSPLLEQAHQHFYRMFKGEALVVDKWFALQASMPARHGDALARVKQLAAHADFTLRNPNRARALIGQFANGNPAGFHRVDGAGYAFWAEQVIAMDALNPQLAARVARAMDRWKKLATAYQPAARAALERVHAHATLSANTKEIIQHALEA